MKKLLGALTFIAAVASGLTLMPLTASATTITFEDGTPAVSGPMPVHTYTVDGIQIDFLNAGYISYPDPISGRVVIAPYVSILPERPEAGMIGFQPIIATFSAPVSFVSIWGICHCPYDGLITSRIDAYGQSGDLLGTDSYTHRSTDPNANDDGYEFGDLLSVSGQNIYGITLSGYFFGSPGNGHSSVFDDLTVVASPVPLPAALPLLAAGLAAMGFMGWRRRKAAGGVV